MHTLAGFILSYIPIGGSANVAGLFLAQDPAVRFAVLTCITANTRKEQTDLVLT
jgi:hypothetical protein